MTPGLPRTPAAWVAALLLAGIVLSAVLGRNGVLDIRHQRGERTALEEEIFRRMRENDELRGRLQSLRRSDRALERMARQELGLVRDGEIVYRFPPKAALSEPALAQR